MPTMVPTSIDGICFAVPQRALIGDENDEKSKPFAAVSLDATAAAAEEELPVSTPCILSIRFATVEMIFCLIESGSNVK